MTKRGRPPLKDEQRMHRYQVMLPNDLVIVAQRLGRGNLSKGIRRALELAALEAGLS